MTYFSFFNFFHCFPVLLRHPPHPPKQTKQINKTAIRTRYWPIKEKLIGQIEEIQSHIWNSTGNQLFLGKNVLQFEKKSERFVWYVLSLCLFRLYFFLFKFFNWHEYAPINSYLYFNNNKKMLMSSRFLIFFFFFKFWVIFLSLILCVFFYCNGSH